MKILKIIFIYHGGMFVVLKTKANKKNSSEKISYISGNGTFFSKSKSSYFFLYFRRELAKPPDKQKSKAS